MATESGPGADLTQGTTDDKTLQNFRTLFCNGKIKNVLYGDATIDVASLADGAGAGNNITVPGAALGDIVVGVSASVDVSGLTVTADVTAANTVTVRVQNESTGTLNLASATWRVIVLDVT